MMIAECAVEPRHGGRSPNRDLYGKDETMKTRLLKHAALGLLCLPLLGLAVGCESQGPAERAGEKVDRAVEDAKDAVDPRGPAEKAGAAVDNAADKVTNP